MDWYVMTVALCCASAPMIVPVVPPAPAPAAAPLAGCWLAGCCANVDREGPAKIAASDTTSVTRVDFLMADSSIVQ
jgi:hypothetical protein